MATGKKMTDRRSSGRVGTSDEFKRLKPSQISQPLPKRRKTTKKK